MIEPFQELPPPRMPVVSAALRALAPVAVLTGALWIVGGVEAAMIFLVLAFAVVGCVLLVFAVMALAHHWVGSEAPVRFDDTLGTITLWGVRERVNLLAAGVVDERTIPYDSIRGIRRTHHGMPWALTIVYADADGTERRLLLHTEDTPHGMVGEMLAARTGLLIRSAND